MRVATSLLSVALLAAGITLANPALAAVAPDAGQTQQGLDQKPLQLPERQSIDLNLPDAPSDQVQGAGPSLQVTGFILEGNRAIPDEQLLPLLDDLKAHGVLATGLIGLRFVTHLGVDAAGIDHAIACIRGFMANASVQTNPAAGRTGVY